MKLFKSFDRTYMGHQAHGESGYAFLNRSARPKFATARQVMEDWFAEYPPSAQTKLARSFKAATYGTHIGAVFELYCYSLMRAQGFTVSVEQVVDAAKGNPIDCVAGTPQGLEFCVEATVIADPEVTEAARPALSTLEDHLGRIPSKALLTLEVVSASKQSLPYAVITSDVARWLENTSFDAQQKNTARADFDGAPTYAWAGRGWELQFELTSREGVDGLVVVEISSDWTGMPSRLEKRLELKADQHSGVTMPYIIAVDALSVNSIRDADSIQSDLLGQEIFLVDRDSGNLVDVMRSSALPRRPDRERGFWIWRSGPRNRHVSAALLVDEVLPWSVLKQTPVLWHNPWALRPLSFDVWEGPQMIFDPVAGAYELRPGKTVKDLFTRDM